MEDSVKLSIDRLCDYLLTFPHSRFTSGKREITMVCPYCGGSKKDPSKTKFYINVDTDSDKFGSYTCFRASCGISGNILTGDFLDVIGFYDREGAPDIKSFIKQKSSDAYGRFHVVSRRKKELKNFIFPNTELNRLKIDYINRRLGINLDLESALKFKVVPDLKMLLEVNNIKIDYKYIDRVEELSNFGVGFISAYNDYVIVRDITKKNLLGDRYSNYNVFNNFDSATKNYHIPTKLNLLSDETSVINVSEGIMDILGVYHHLSIDREYENQIFAAACGAGIVKTIKEYIRLYGLTNCKINVFSDADVDIEKYNSLKSLKKYIDGDITIYYNEISKDFGVRKDQIKINKIKL